jgi:hypothetical protein
LNPLTKSIAVPVEEKRAMGRRARECYHRRYDMQENAKAIIGLFEKVESDKKSS